MKSILYPLLLGLCLSGLYGQEPPHEQYLPHPLDTLAQYPLQSMTIFLNDMNEGGIEGQKGLAIATYSWDEQGRIQSAAVLELRQGQIRGKDSVAWLYHEDSVFCQYYNLTFRDPDYEDYADDIDFGALDQMYLPPMSVSYMEEADTFLVADGRLAQELDGFRKVSYRYDDNGRLVEKQTVIPERVAMDMGGYNWETYTYNGLGRLTLKSEVSTGPDDRRDTAVHVFQYDGDGNLITHIQPSPSLPGVSSMKQYAYEDGQLIRAEHRRTTFRSSGPPDYTRKKVSLHFETTYQYEDGKMVEEKMTRNEELEPEGWLRYGHNERGLLAHRTIMNPFENRPGRVFTYDYTFHP